MALFTLNTPFIDHVLKIIHGLQDNLPATLFDLLIGIIVIRVTIWVLRVTLKRTRMQVGLRYVLTSIAQTILWICLVIVLLQEIGLGGVILFFTGSIAAIGIAMAAGGSTLVSDVVAAIFLANDRDFNIGDEVIAGWEPVTQGVIERMDARRIRLRDAEGVLHVVPNSVVERRAWIVVRRRAELSALARAAKDVPGNKAKSLDKPTKALRKFVKSRNNAQ